MPSPFPGMNPYLEHPNVWHDFHESLIPAIKLALSPQIKHRYVTRIDENVYIHDLIDESTRLVGRPDLGVASRADFASGGGVAIAEPERVTMPEIDRESESFIEIRDRSGNELVTAIEVLSPINKQPGVHRNRYLDKRRQLLAAGVNLVEIDLLRGGRRMPPCDDRSDYCVLVSRRGAWPIGGIWRIGLRDPLPEVSVPLKAGDAEARLNFRRLLDDVYDGSDYDVTIYGDELDPAMDAADAAWAAQFVPRKEA